MSDKEIAIEIIRTLSEDVSLADIVEEIRVFAAIRKGQQDADAGRTIPHEVVVSRFREWIGRSAPQSRDHGGAGGPPGSG